LARKFTLYRFFSQYFTKKFVYTFKQRFPALYSGFTGHFPAIQLKRKLDNWDYAANFSSELLVAGLVLVVAAANILSFGVFDRTTAEHDFSDASLAARLLTYHTEMNPSLYAKQNSIKTTVVRSQGLINEAYADDGALSAGFNNDTLATADELAFEDGGVVSKPNPDTTRELMSKQITVYETQPGESVYAVAEKFKLSINTIKWANNLSSNDLKPGWYLKILPVDGVLYQADSNDTLPDIANYFKGNLETIIAYNGLENAEDIEEGQWIIVPGGSVPPPPPAPTPKPQASKAAPAPKANAPRITPLRIPSGRAHIFPRGYCTWYAAMKVGGVPHGGNANAWLRNAAAIGIPTGSTPVAGSVMVTTDNARYGHVAYVESVNGNKVTISEMNYVGFGKTNTRTLTVGDRSIRGYIYYK
jgi:surface antigen